MTNHEIENAVRVATNGTVQATQVMRPTERRWTQGRGYHKAPAEYIKICLAGDRRYVTLKDINLIVLQLGLSPSEVTFYSNTIHVPLSIRHPELPF